MILLDNDQILSAIRRSLDEHVLPLIDDEFARIQVTAATLALDEVVDRLRRGDPFARLNPRFEGRLAVLSADLDASGEPPEDAVLGRALRQALDSIEAVDDARERHAALAALLDPLVVGDGPGRARLRQIIQEEAGLVAAEDSVWMCGPAIESLQ